MKKTFILTICIFITFSYSFAKSPNPLSRTQDAIDKGKSLYNLKCSKCHGPKARGINNGHTKTPDLRKYRRGYNAFIDVLVNGYSRMPAWGGMGKLNNTQMNQLAAYLESLANKSANWND